MVLLWQSMKDSSGITRTASCSKAAFYREKDDVSPEELRDFRFLLPLIDASLSLADLPDFLDQLISLNAENRTQAYRPLFSIGEDDPKAETGLLTVNTVETDAPLRFSSCSAKVSFWAGSIPSTAPLQ